MIVLEEGDIRAMIDPGLGGALADLSFRTPGRGLVPLMRPAPESATWFNDLSCYILAPWCNRVAGATFDWLGQRRRLKADWNDGTAIHGLVKDRSWRIEQRSPVSAVLACEVDQAESFPWPFRVEAAYQVGTNSLVSSLVLTHHRAGRNEPMPAGLGFHPFWRRSLGSAAATVQLSGLRRYPHTGMIPTGPAIEDPVTRRFAQGTGLDDLDLDDVFAGSSDRAVIAWPEDGVRIRYRCSASLGHTVIFTGMPEAFCLEPVSMVNNGFNLASRGWAGTGVQALAPGESMLAKWRIDIDTM